MKNTKLIRKAIFCWSIALCISCNGQTNSGAANKALSGYRATSGNVVSQLDSAIWVIFQAGNNDYWFGSDGGGLYRYDGKKLIHFSTRDGLCNNRVREIKEDKSGSIFVTTNEGISKFDGLEFTTLKVDRSSGGEWKLTPDDLWFKALNDSGAYRYDGRSLYQLKFPESPRHNEYYRTNPGSRFNPYDVYYVYKDRSGVVWLGTSSMGICRYDGKKFSWIYEEHLTQIEGGGSFGIRSIIEDKDGKFWFCNTMYRYDVQRDEKEKGMINYTRQKGIDIKAPDGRDRIYFQSAVEDNNGDLWMLTYQQGIWRYNGKDVIRYTVKDGDREVKLFAMYKDNSGSLWAAAPDAGAYRFNGTTFEKFKP